MTDDQKTQHIIENEHDALVKGIKLAYDFDELANEIANMSPGHIVGRVGSIGTIIEIGAERARDNGLVDWDTVSAEDCDETDEEMIERKEREEAIHG